MEAGQHPQPGDGVVSMSCPAVDAWAQRAVFQPPALLESHRCLGSREVLGAPVQRVCEQEPLALALA